MPRSFFKNIDQSSVSPGARDKYDYGNYTRVELWERDVPIVATDLARLVAEKTDASEAETRKLFLKRTAGLRVYLGGRVHNQGGHFDAGAWTAVVAGGLTVFERSSALAHEIGHASSVNRVNQDSNLNPVYVQTGIDRYTVKPVVGSVPFTGTHAEKWINEGLIDLSARRVTGNVGEVSYVTGVSLLSGLFEVSPETEAELYRSCFFTGDSDSAVSAIDANLYSGWAAEVGEHIEYMGTHTADNDPGYRPIREIHATLPNYLNSVVNRHLDEILG